MNTEYKQRNSASMNFIRLCRDYRSEGGLNLEDQHIKYNTWHVIYEYNNYYDKHMIWTFGKTYENHNMIKNLLDTQESNNMIIALELLMITIYKYSIYE